MVSSKKLVSHKTNILQENQKPEDILLCFNVKNIRVYFIIYRLPIDFFLYGEGSMKKIVKKTFLKNCCIRVSFIKPSKYTLEKQGCQRRPTLNQTWDKLDKSVNFSDQLVTFWLGKSRLTD